MCIFYNYEKNTMCINIVNKYNFYMKVINKEFIHMGNIYTSSYEEIVTLDYGLGINMVGESNIQEKIKDLQNKIISLQLELEHMKNNTN